MLIADRPQLDGYLARKWNQKSVLGSILDPAADKALMTTLVATLAWSELLPSAYRSIP
jgi:cardiolipin synthase